MAKYIIKTQSGYVGLFWFGKSYQIAKNKCNINESPERAKAIAQAFKGELIEV